MDTSKLLWSMVVRGCEWTAGVGALLGAAYGIVLLLTAMFALVQLDNNNAGLPLFAVLVVAIVIAALFGAIVAGIIGLIAGPMGGCLCALMTRFLFMPPRSERLYHIVAGIAGALYGALAVAVAVRLISTSGFAPPVETQREIIMLYVLPCALGGLAGIYLSHQVIVSSAEKTAVMQAPEAI